jgi:hypothetical protein
MPKQNQIDRCACKMLCPVCRDVERLPLAWQEANGNTVFLECGHSRTPCLLPASGVSLEDVVNDTPEAARLFPYQHDDVVNVNFSLAIEQMRENWK